MAKRKRAEKRGGLAPYKYLSDTQLHKFRQYVKDKADLARIRGGPRGVFDELIVELLVNTGLRASELCSRASYLIKHISMLSVVNFLIKEKTIRAGIESPPYGPP